MIDRLHVYVSGRVQGVFFRATTQQQAQALGLTGWVRNCPDGRVEAEFEGSKERLSAMLRWCHQGPSLARVTAVEAQWDQGDARYDAFQCRY